MPGETILQLGIQQQTQDTLAKPLNSHNHTHALTLQCTYAK